MSSSRTRGSILSITSMDPRVREDDGCTPQASGKASCVGWRFSMANLSNAALRKTPCANLPYGSVTNSAITTPRWTASSSAKNAVSRHSMSAKPVKLVKNNRAMKPKSIGFCVKSAVFGSRRKFSHSKPAGPTSKTCKPVRMALKRRGNCAWRMRSRGAG